MRGVGHYPTPLSSTDNLSCQNVMSNNNISIRMNQKINEAISFVADTIAEMYRHGVLPKEEAIAEQFSGKIPLDTYARLIETIQIHSRRYNYHKASQIAEAAGVLSEFWAEYAESGDVDDALSKVLPS